MVDEVLHPGEVGVARRRCAVLPALVVLEQVTAAVAVVERRTCKDVVGLEVGVQIAVEAVGVFPAEVRVDPADREIHLGQPPGGVVRLLAIDADVADPAAVLLDELLRLHKHSARPAAGVEDAAQNVLGAVLLVAEANVADEVDQLPQPLLHVARLVSAEAGKPGRTRGASLPPGKRLTVDVVKRTATLDGKTYECSSELALRWVQVLADHPGERIPALGLKNYDDKLDGIRTDLVRRYLPEHVLALIDSKPGAGSRLKN